MKTVFAFLVLSLAVAQAGTIYVSDGTNLYDIDPTTAAVLNTETLGAPNLAAMTIGPDGKLYGLFGAVNQVATLGIINPGNGSVSLAPDNASLNPQGLAFDPGGDLYGFVSVVLGGGLQAEIVGIDPTSGGVISTFLCGPGGHSLAFPSNNTAIVVEGVTLVQVAPNPTPCGAIGGPGGGGTPCSGGSMGFQMPSLLGPGSGDGGPPAGPSTGNTGLIDISNGGTFFYAIQSGSGNPVLVSFDESAYNNSGTENVVGTLPAGVDSIAATDSSFAPEPSAILLLCLGVGSMVVWRRYRRRA